MAMSERWRRFRFGGFEGILADSGLAAFGFKPSQEDIGGAFVL